MSMEILFQASNAQLMSGKHWPQAELISTPIQSLQGTMDLTLKHTALRLYHPMIMCLSKVM